MSYSVDPMPSRAASPSTTMAPAASHTYDDTEIPRGWQPPVPSMSSAPMADTGLEIRGWQPRLPAAAPNTYGQMPAGWAQPLPAHPMITPPTSDPQRRTRTADPQLVRLPQASTAYDAPGRGGIGSSFLPSQMPSVLAPRPVFSTPSSQASSRWPSPRGQGQWISREPASRDEVAIKQDAVFIRMQGVNEGFAFALDLSGLRIASFNGGFYNNTTLTDVNLSYNQLREVPPSIAQMPNLLQLNVSHNLLTELVTTVGFLNRLKRLNASHNALTTLPPSMCLNANLQVVDISHNLLQEVPQPLLQLSTLTVVDLNHNLIETLPTITPAWRSVSLLNLSFNLLRQTPVSHPNLKEGAMVIGMFNPDAFAMDRAQMIYRELNIG